MQTFLPYGYVYKVDRTLPNKLDMFKLGIQASVQSLDYKRLGKQRVEAMQTYNQVTKGAGGYRHHPVNAMWQRYPKALAYYQDMCIQEWLRRGYTNTMQLLCTDDITEADIPDWYGSKKLHLSHRYNLLRKDFIHYSQFGWFYPDDYKTRPYIWSDFAGVMLFDLYKQNLQIPTVNASKDLQAQFGMTNN